MTARIECEVVFLSAKEGGRSNENPPNLSGRIYRPHLVVREPEMLGVAFEDGPSAVRSGVKVTATALFLFNPQIDYSALQPGVTFAIKEGWKLVGHGTVKRRFSSPNERDFTPAVIPDSPQG